MVEPRSFAVSANFRLNYLVYNFTLYQTSAVRNDISGRGLSRPGIGDEDVRVRQFLRTSVEKALQKAGYSQDVVLTILILGRPKNNQKFLSKDARFFKQPMLIHIKLTGLSDERLDSKIRRAIFRNSSVPVKKSPKTVGVTRFKNNFSLKIRY